MGILNENHAVQNQATVAPTATLQIPRPPSPSADRGIFPSTESSLVDSGGFPDPAQIDISTLRSMAALRMLCSTIETLVRITGDIPPTPPISPPSTPNLRIEKENISRRTRDHRRLQDGDAEDRGDADGVPAKAKTPIGSPVAGPMEPLHVIGSNAEPLHIQHGAITRKFYSKKPPPISLEEYLMRMHRYCPMSTAVYLATSLYIFKLAIIEKIIPVTPRNAHRLVLAGLRVAMKALEDFSYPQRRFAKVGGVSETELGRLEVSFCFVTNFELRVDSEGLLEHARSITDIETLCQAQGDFSLHLSPLGERRTLIVGRSKPPTTTTPAAA